MRNIRGASTTEALVQLSIGLAVALVIGSAALGYFDKASRGVELNIALDKVSAAGRAFYGDDILRTRCMTPSLPLNISNLINRGYIKSTDVLGRSWTMNIAYINSTTAGYTKPASLIITIDFPSLQDMQKMLSEVNPSSAVGQRLSFQYSLAGNPSGDWSNFNKTTGCFA
ncbi:hypothetical protein M2404_003886 [Rheinheimera pacifica]|uniref:hypothetical protein n=1 Tax=Rheinheimera pacifica TaxID=173990 RepID=UPI002166FEE1|nr:hypothetical protein [Rheinheimera pacifica]MCS4309514.1 hypothetical protein [Rheinheimera pacifica]